MLLRSIVLCVCLALTTSSLAFGQRANLTGSWTATSLHVTWRIGDWGPACGPRPSGGGQGGGIVQLTDHGSSFQLTGLGRTYRSRQCWEQMPGLNPVSSNASGSTFTASCSTSAGDPRQAKVTTTWTVRENTLYFDESGQYQFIVQGQNCTASVRRTRLLHRVIQEVPQPAPAATSAPEAAGATPQTPTAAEPPPPLSTCNDPGPPRSLEVSPESKLMMPGERFSFRATVRDARGCVLPILPTWNIQQGAELVRVVGPGTLEVLPDAPNGRVELQASIGGRSVQVSARVVTRDTYEALLAAGDYEATGESSKRAETTLARSTVDAQVEVVAPESSRTALFLLVGGATTTTLALLGALLWRRRRTHVPAGHVPSSDVAGGLVATGELSSGEMAASADDGASRSQQAQRSRGKVCPLCGETYPPDGAQFCGKDGAQLVPMN